MLRRVAAWFSREGDATPAWQAKLEDEGSVGEGGKMYFSTELGQWVIKGREQQALEEKRKKNLPFCR